MDSISNETRDHQPQSFHHYFESWIAEQAQYLQEMISITLPQPEHQPPMPREEEERRLQVLIDRAVEHYEEYYQVKSEWSNQDVMTMFSPSWTSSLEDGFYWIGGWRPSTAFHLVYSKSGIQLERRLSEMFQVLEEVNDLGALAPVQLSAMDKLKRKMIKEERLITEEMAKHQETVADKSMVELSHTSIGEAVDEELVGSVLGLKEEGLRKLLEMGDNLRLKTLKEVITILNPTQKLHFLITAAQLHLKVHELGHKSDTARGRRW